MDYIIYIMRNTELGTSELASVFQRHPWIVPFPACGRDHDGPFRLSVTAPCGVPVR